RRGVPAQPGTQPGISPRSRALLHQLGCAPHPLAPPGGSRRPCRAQARRPRAHRQPRAARRDSQAEKRRTAGPGAGRGADGFLQSVPERRVVHCDQEGKRMTARLMVIVPDLISDFVRKGEVIDRYYNPGGLFDEVHVVLVNDDRPDAQAMQRMVGKARLHIHNIPSGRDLFVRSLGWRPWLLNRWAQSVIELARALRPALIRCHGALLNAYAAYRV